MIAAWIFAVIGVIIVIAAIGWIIVVSNKDPHSLEFSKGANVLGAIIVALVGLALAGGCLFWLYGTASGQREQKSFASETGGGLSRVVTVYDLQGDVIGKYEGKFDIQTDNTRVFFDLPQKDGSTKRVQIYNATVIVEEK